MTRTMQLLGAELKHLGFHHYAIGSGFHSRKLKFETTFKDEWQQHYFSQGYADIDPLPFCALAGRSPLRWTEIRQRMSRSPVMNDAYDFGLQQGFTLSCNGLVISSYHDGKLTDGDLTYIKDTMHRISLSSNSKVPRLNSTQQGLVDLLGVGLSQVQIAEILGISPNSVKSRKRLLFEKFDVNSEAQLLRVLRNQ